MILTFQHSLNFEEIKSQSEKLIMELGQKKKEK